MGLDPSGIRELRDDSHELSEKEGIAIFISSHLLSEIEEKFLYETDHLGGSLKDSTF